MPDFKNHDQYSVLPTVYLKLTEFTRSGMGNLLRIIDSLGC